MAVAQSTTKLPAATLGPLQALGQLPVARQLGVMAGLAVSVALGLGIILWSRTPSYSVLTTSLAGKEASEVVESLGRARVPYRIDEISGAVLVPAAKLQEARMLLAAEGLPRSADVGFELLQKEQGFGTSQFLEQARYQRALEVELARSVATLANVQAARVHLALPPQSVFVRERKRPSASVLVNLYGGRGLDESQVAAITHLVAASVPNMEASGVRVVDQRGRLLSGGEQSRDVVLTEHQFDYTRRLEQYYIKRIEDILSPVLGPEGVKAQVVADVDFTRTEQTRESFNPDLPSLRSEQVVEESSTGSLLGGVPGALTNQPPGPAAAPEQAGGEAGAGQDGGKPSQARKQATRNFELDRTISHSTLPATNLRRLSVAVVLDDRRVPGNDGLVQRQSLAPEELERFEALIKEAIGFSPARGDSVSVMNVPFSEAMVPEALPAPPIWEQPWVWDLGKQALGIGLVLFLIFGVLRPAARRLTQHPVARPAAVPALAGPDGGELRDDQLKLSASGAGVAQLPDESGHQRNLETVRNLVTQDPKRVAQVVKNWVGEDG